MKISRLGEIPTVYPVCGDCRPQDGFLSFEKVAKKYRKTSVFPIGGRASADLRALLR